MLNVKSMCISIYVLLHQLFLLKKKSFLVVGLHCYFSGFVIVVTVGVVIICCC